MMAYFGCRYWGVKAMRKRGRGFAIVISLGILAVLSMIAVNFAYSTLLERRSVGNYLNDVKAKYAAEAGLARAIIELKAATPLNSHDSLSEAWNSGYNGTIGGNSYNVTIEDEQRKVNINNASSQLLENLPGLNPGIAANIIGYRTVQPFIAVEELRLVPGIDAAKYNGLAGLITVTSYVDSHFNRSPININTAPAAVLQAVFEKVNDGVGGISGGEASDLAGRIIGDRLAVPFTGWSDFNASIDRAVSDGDINAAEAAAVKNNCNPNRTKPATYTTEFCFNSGGIYNLQSAGIANSGGVQAATTQKQSIVKIFDIWNQTTRDEFMQPWLNDEGEEPDLADGDIVWVTWMDSCPVRSDQNWDSGPYDTIPGSLKLGHWDNFQEYVTDWGGNPNHINDWTAWYWGTGNLYISGGRLVTGGGWTQANLQPGGFWPRRWNTQGINCTISMQGAVVYPAWDTGRYAYQFLYRGTSGSNVDTTLIVDTYVPWWDTADLYFRLSLKAWAGVDSSDYTYLGEPVRITLRLTASNMVAAGYLSGGVVGGQLMFANSNKCNNGQVVRQYQGWVDNVRVIPGASATIFRLIPPSDFFLFSYNGRYIATPLLFDHQVRAGTITGTTTIPSTANAASETITYMLFPDASVDMTNHVDNNLLMSTGDLTSTLQYVVYFSSNNADLFETPVLEDVTITYIDSTSSIYSK